MKSWRGVVLGCTLALGCAGSLPEQEDERTQASTPGDMGDEELTATWDRPEPGSARLVRDIFPPSDLPSRLGPVPESLVEFRGKLYFAANFEDGRRELWKSDGTSGSTVPILRFPPFPGGFFIDRMTDLTPVGSRLFFVVGDEPHGRELWVSDGTTGGTRLVKDLTPGPEDGEPFDLRAVGRTLLFFRFVPSTPTAPSRTELWKSDGTEAGTVRVKDLGPESSVLTSKALVGDTLFFALSEAEHGTELWKSDGTEAGTVLIKDIVPGPESSNPFSLRTVGRHIFFAATEPAHGTEMWRTDGTEAGTMLVADLTPGPASEFPQVLEAVGNCLYVARVDPSDRLMRLYRLKNSDDGVGVRLVTTLPNPFADDPDAFPFITTSAVAGRKLFFGLGISTSGPAPRDVQLWVTDGTGSGTKLLHRPLSLSDEFGSELFALDGRILFTGNEEATGLEPWESDGTVAGTRRLQDIAPGPVGSFPRSYTRVGSRVFFVADDTVHGTELWVLPLRR
ncbi:MAG TPA: ELWxxDGT repeat protein [Archangium sp.]|uniref:ELWxxDGT repeat protein n=1 Tax=Archangium sp. TaxID=1872627 RepID=UPI002ED78B85